ncbi:MAG: hypothetical protein H6668_01405 [Ardenticatenaceae bacterium]|nr:hypothetical protein [Ardenticatenaceae bacterium]
MLDQFGTRPGNCAVDGLDEAQQKRQQLQEMITLQRFCRGTTSASVVAARRH